MDGMITENGIVWSEKGASVQRLISGEYRAINHRGVPRRFRRRAEAIRWAQTK